jgi:hypothetical protein
MAKPLYVEWAEGIVGSPLPSRTWGTNDVTGAVESALSGSDNFAFFTARFGERLARLARVLDAADRPALLEKIANIGDRDNWFGFYTELAAWDFFSALGLAPRVEVAPPSPQLGTTSVPIDGRLSLLDDLHFHVKILGDTTKRVAESIQRQVSAANPSIALDFSYPLDLGSDALAAERANLVSEIRQIVGAGLSKIQVVRRTALGLTVRIHPRRPGVTITEHGYNPYRQAKNLRYLLLSHAHELLRDDRNLRVHVVHPWFNLHNASDFGGAQRDFFRATARRLAFELSRDPQPLSNVLCRTPTSLTVRDAARRTSGVLFVVDYSVTGLPGRDPSIPYDPGTPVGVLQGFVYANPNALPTSDARPTLRQLAMQARPLVAMHDDFADDDY